MSPREENGAKNDAVGVGNHCASIVYSNIQDNIDVGADFREILGRFILENKGKVQIAILFRVVECHRYNSSVSFYLVS